MVEISENKVEKMSDYAEKMLKYGGKLMQCLDEVSEDGMGQREYDEEDEEEMDERGGYGNRGGNRSRGGVSQRRGVKGTGRYSRYR